jgi:histidine triad (HIT) family protein
MKDCLFCKIVKGDIPSALVYEDEKVIAFKDIHPLAAVHILFIHREHTRNVGELTRERPDQLNDLFAGIEKWTAQNQLESKGYRVVTNIGPDGGQTVFHTHFHVLGGEKLGAFGA